MLNKVQLSDALSEVETMLENDCYTLEEALKHIALCYEVEISVLVEGRKAQKWASNFDQGLKDCIKD